MELKHLEANGIFVSKGLVDEGALPQHINKVRTKLLGFTWPVLGLVDEDGKVIHPAGDRHDKDAEQHTANLLATVNRFEMLKCDAKILHKGQDREAEWQTFFLLNFFRPLANMGRVQDKDDWNTVYTKFSYDHFESAQSRPWTLFSRRGGEGNGYRYEDREQLSEPKPDWVAFFPIYDHDYVGDRIPTSRRWRMTEELQPRIAEDAVFTLQTLAHLAEHHKVQSSTARLFSRPQKDVVLSDYICFPWLVVEHKKAVKGKDEEQCYCQAANAGTAAVMMLESLCRIEKGHGPDNDHILPVVTMTTVDKIVKIWIAYSCKPSDDAAAKYRMDCIWKGDMTRLKDLFKLHAILENTYRWAVRVLKPEITAHINRWMRRPPLLAARETREDAASSPAVPGQSGPRTIAQTPTAVEGQATEIGGALLNSMSEPNGLPLEQEVGGKGGTQRPGELENQGEVEGQEAVESQGEVEGESELEEPEALENQEGLDHQEALEDDEELDGDYVPESKEELDSEEEFSSKWELGSEEDSSGEEELGGERALSGEAELGSEDEPTEEDVVAISAEVPGSREGTPTEEDTDSEESARGEEQILEHKPTPEKPGAREKAPSGQPTSKQPKIRFSTPKLVRHEDPEAQQATQISRSAESRPTRLQSKFEAFQTQSVSDRGSSAPRPKKVDQFDFGHGVFDFTVPGAPRMQLPGFASAMPFTPPASTDNTPLKQPPARTPDRPASPSDGRGNKSQGPRPIFPPTPGPEVDKSGDGKHHGPKWRVSGNDGKRRH